MYHRWGFMIAGLGLVLGTQFGCGTGGPADTIVRVSRQNNSGTYAYFREIVLGEKEYKLGSIDQSGSKDVVELVSKTPNAIGYSGMGYATEGVKMLSVARDPGAEPVAPTAEHAADGTYPLARGLYIYIMGEPTGAMKHYLDWIRSSEGQAVVAEVGYVSVAPVEMTDTGSPPAGTIKVAGSDTMVNLAQAWAETYGKKYGNVVDVQVSGGGSGVGIAKLIDGTVDMANASREMKQEERDAASQHAGGAEVNEVTVALDALAVYVHKDNPLSSITLQQLAEIYGDGGTIERWSQIEGWSRDAKP
jgi:ABC-type phosphate transport system substrate-binding protein